MRHFKICLGPGKGCPLLPSITLKFKVWGIEVGQVQDLPKTSPVETQKTFEIRTHITGMFIHKKNSKVIS